MKKKKLISVIITCLLLVSTVGVSTTYAASNQWQTVGSHFSLGMVSDVSLFIDNGTSYVAYKDHLSANKVTVKKYSGSSWTTVGSAGLSAGLSEYISLYVYDGTPYVAYKDMTQAQKVSVKKFNGTSWEVVGTEGFSDGKSEYISLYVYEGTPYVAYKDSVKAQKLTVKKYDGNAWVTIGAEGFSESKAEYISLYVYNGTPYVAFQDLMNAQKATVMKYDGSKWTTVGKAGFSIARADYLSLKIDNGTPYVAYKDYGSQQKASVMKFNGTSWVVVGKTGFSVGTIPTTGSDDSGDEATNISLFLDNGTPYVAYADKANAEKATVMKYNGTSWVAVGKAGLSSSKVEYVSLYISNGVPYLAYKDTLTGGKGILMKYVSDAEPVAQPTTPPEPVQPEETVTPPVNDTIAGFTDISGHWAVDTIVEMNSKNIINGVGDGLFEPDRAITRAEFASSVVRALNLSKGNTGNLFTDIYPSDWYSDDILAAYENGLITGYNDGSFKPQLSISREEAMAIIVRAMKIKGLSTELNIADETNILSAFSDRDQASEWAKQSIATCIKAGIISGRSNTTIAPKDSITRAETAVIMQRLLNK